MNRLNMCQVAVQKGLLFLERLFLVLLQSLAERLIVVLDSGLLPD